MRHFSYANHKCQHSYFMSTPDAATMKVCKMRQSCEAQVLLKDDIRRYLFHLRDIIRLRGTLEAIPNMMRADEERQKDKVWFKNFFF